MNPLRSAHPNYDDEVVNRTPWIVPGEVLNGEVVVKATLNSDGVVIAF